MPPLIQWTSGGAPVLPLSKRSQVIELVYIRLYFKIVCAFDDAGAQLDLCGKFAEIGPHALPEDAGDC